MGYIDLTIPIENGTSSYPGEPGGYFLPFSDLETGGFRAHQLLLYTHLGTHLDAPSHFIPSGRGVDEISLDSLLGEALLIDSDGTDTHGEIRKSHLKMSDPITPGARIVLRTGWHLHWGQTDYYKGFPNLSLEVAEYLVKQKISLLAIDMPTPHAVLAKEVHELLLGNNVVIVEGLINLDQITNPNGWLMCLPLRLKGMDGSPARVIWRDE